MDVNAFRKGLQMKRAFYLIPLLALFAILSAGCYTKFYRPGMETAGGANETLYNRYDSTAIDTTLTREDYVGSSSYPDDRWNSWYYWGRPRGYTRWGFDFHNFSPDYYWSYYGYYDYYGTPWWYDWNTPWYWRNYPGGTTTPGEPPSQRPRGRRDQDAGGNYIQSAPAPSSSPVYVQPNTNTTPPPITKDGNDDSKKSSDSNKRDGKKGR